MTTFDVNSRVSKGDFYDPETFQVIVRRGEPVNQRQAKRLKELDFWEMAVEGEIGMDVERFKQRFGPLIPGVPNDVQPNGWGKRKNALACVSVAKRKGAFQINGVASTQYFASPQWQKIVAEPFRVLNLDPQDWTVQGYATGATIGERRQARAIAHALASALVALARDAAEIELRRQLLRGQFIITLTPPNWR